MPAFLAADVQRPLELLKEVVHFVLVVEFDFEPFEVVKAVLVVGEESFLIETEPAGLVTGAKGAGFDGRGIGEGAVRGGTDAHYEAPVAVLNLD